MSFLESPWTWFVFVFGALIGSFLNVCIYRIPEGQFFASARSRCRHCNAQIPAYLNIPILGFLLLRGRTLCCKKPLSWQYPVVELLTASLFVACYWKTPFMIQYGAHPFEIDPTNALRFAHLSTFVALMIVCSFIDIRLMIIPDVISLPMIAATPLVVWLHPDLTWQSALAGVIVGGGILYAVAWLYFLLRKQVGMGFGDVKLLAAIGGWLGVEAVLPAICWGSILGSVVGISMMLYQRKMDMKLAIPFGPFLATGAVLHMFVSWSDLFP